MKFHNNAVRDKRTRIYLPVQAILSSCEVKNPTKTPMIYDSPMPYVKVLGKDIAALYTQNVHTRAHGAAPALTWIPQRHGKMANCLFVDGHVESISKDSVTEEEMNPFAD